MKSASDEARLRRRMLQSQRRHQTSISNIENGLKSAINTDIPMISNDSMLLTSSSSQPPQFGSDIYTQSAAKSTSSEARLHRRILLEQKRNKTMVSNQDTLKLKRIMDFPCQLIEPLNSQENELKCTMHGKAELQADCQLSTFDWRWRRILACVYSCYVISASELYGGSRLLCNLSHRMCPRNG